MTAGPGFVEFPRAALEAPIGELFERQAARHPDRLAVKGRHGALTYAELDRAANRLADAILARGGPGREPVALLFEHDAPVLAAILAVLKTGRPYLSLESHHAASRAAAILAHSEAPLLVCDAAHLGRARELASSACQVLDASALGPAQAAEPPGLAVSAHAPACLAYTSGSTGEPKGVVGSHRSITHRVMVFVNGARIAPADRLSLLESVGVGGSFRSVFGGPLAGACVVPFNLRAQGADAIAAWLIREEITVCSLAASVFRHFASALPAGEHFPALRYVGIGREAVLQGDVELHRTRFSPGCVLVNVMGSAESGTIRELFVDPATPLVDGVVPAGYAIPDKEVLLVGDDGQPVPPGEAGEIVVRSEFLSLGYWRRPDLDAKVFPPDPGGGAARLCRTGDIGRMLPDGCLLHLGRKDARVKLRGGFVDPAEVEAVLLGHVGLKGAAVVIREDRPGDQRLVAYVVPAADRAPTVGEIRRFVQARLGDRLVPSTVVLLDALPRSPNGKLDRRALPAPSRARPALATAHALPRTRIEGAVASIWAEALDLDEVGIHDDFLELGGTSLLAGRLTASVCERFGVEIPAQALLETPTVAEMGVVVVEHLLRAVEAGSRERMLADIEGQPAADG